MPEPRTLYLGGLVFDGVNAPVPGQGVLVENGRIKRLAPAGEFDGYAGARVDTTGRTLLPGLMDCHVHFIFGGEGSLVAAHAGMSNAQIAMRALDFAQATLRGGVTSVRDLGGKDYLEIAVRDAINSGRHLGPTIRCAGRVICMTGGHGWFMGREADGPVDVVKAVRENIKAGADFIKFIATGGVATPNVDPLLAQLTPEELTAGIAEAKRFGRPSTAHAQGAPGIRNAIDAGIASIEHGFQMTDDLIADMKARDIHLVPTLVAIERTLSQPQAIPDYVREKAERFGAMHQDSVKRFYQAGAPIAFGTDAGTSFNYHGENVRELMLMVELGIAPLDALRSATSVAGKLMGHADRGRIAQGWWADFLIVEGDPSRDIQAVADRANHRLVVKNGFDVHAMIGAAGKSMAAVVPRFAAPAF